MRLQVCRTHNKQRICCRVRFIERVLCKLLGVFPNFFSDVERIAVFYCAIVPVFLKLTHNIELLLTHCLTQLICLTSRKTAHDHGHLHDLFLVDHRAVGFFQDRTQTIIVIVDGALALYHLYIVFNHARLKRARAVKCDGGHNVRKALWRNLREQAHIQRAFNLEQTIHVEGHSVLAKLATHQGKRTIIFNGDFFRKKLFARGCLNIVAGTRKHAQGTQAKEVHL